MFSWIKLECDVKNDQNKIRINFRYRQVFIEQGLRGGIPYICKRFSEGNNKGTKTHDLEKESRCIMYLDVNNFYDWGMSQHLPYGGFKWLKNVDNFDVNSTSQKSPTGYILD